VRCWKIIVSQDLTSIPPESLLLLRSPGWSCLAAAGWRTAARSAASQAPRDLGAAPDRADQNATARAAVSATITRRVAAGTGHIRQERIHIVLRR
jgi:hypothetical protein